MNRIPMSPAAAALLRAFAARAAVPRDRILLTNVRSTDWQSLTFVGERHHFDLRMAGPESVQAARRLCDGLGEAEFSIHGQIVADVGVIGEIVPADDGSTAVTIEALTVAE